MYERPLRADELYHFGVKGMHWGVRRYQNYDGSYTQKGMERYRQTTERVNKRKDAYKQAKESYKTGGVNKSTVKRAKADLKLAKRQQKMSYKQLNKDKKADKGKNLYRSGNTITNDTTVTSILGTSSTAAATIAAYANQYGNTKVRNIAASASVALGAAAVAKQMSDSYRASQLRAYYGHESSKTLDNRFGTNVKRK